MTESSTATAALPATELDDVRWSYQSRRYAALGHGFTFRTTDPHLGRYLDSLFRHFGSPEPTTTVSDYSLHVDRTRKPFPFALYGDGESLGHFAEGRYLLAEFVWHINNGAIRETTDHLTLHASAAAWRGRTLLFPAPMESGKTTLVAGLVRAGFDYVTDETVAIDPSSLMVTAFPRALSIDPGSWEVLRDLQPNPGPQINPYLGDQWQVSPDAIRPDAVAHRTEPRFVIVPRYRAGSETMLTPMRRAEAVRVMGDNAFNFQTLGPPGLQVLAAVARRSYCYRLTVGELVSACELVRALVEEPSR